MNSSTSSVSVEALGGKAKRETLPLQALLLDKDNPRFANRGAGNEQRAILNHIVDRFGVDDVLSSLAVNGYFQSEPLVCQNTPKGTGYIVKEGNRRLAACLIISGDERATDQKIRSAKFAKLWEEHDSPPIENIPVITFPHGEQKQILPYLGVRHIASTQPWDSYAKAAWVAQGVETNKLTVPDIAKMIGDQHKTIQRLLEGYYLVNQLIDTGKFDPNDSIRKGRGSMSQYPFSWVYTILMYVTVRKFLGIENYSAQDKKPLKKENLQKGEFLLRSMFGSRSRGQHSAIDDSRQLGRLSKVYDDDEKIHLLKLGKNIDEIETLTQPIKQQLAEELDLTKDMLRTLIARLVEHGISQDAAEDLVHSSTRNKKLAIKLDKELQKIASGDDPKEDE